MPSEFKKLPPSTFEECKQRAQLLLDILGQPPYKSYPLLTATQEEMEDLSKATMHILSEYVLNWMPQLVEKEKAVEAVFVVGAKADARLGEE